MEDTFTNTRELDNGPDEPEHVADRNGWAISTSEHTFVYSLTIEGLIQSLYLVQYHCVTE